MRLHLPFLLFFIQNWIPAETMAQITPPGYDRAVKMELEKRNIPRLDRDSMTIIDTVAIFDPATNEESIQVITSTYSLRDYCTSILRMGNPDILLDEQPHTVVDPETYGDMIVRLTPQGKIVVTKPKE